MANIGHFDPTQVAPREDFTPIPNGEYPMVITDSDTKAVKPPKEGQYLELTYMVTDGEFKGRKVWSRHNYDNPNAKTVEIAERELSAICHAVGWLKPLTETAVLHNKPMLVRVELVKADGINNQKDRNEVKAWKALAGGAGNGQQATSTTQMPSSAPATTASPSSAPWKRNAA